MGRNGIGLVCLNIKYRQFPLISASFYWLVYFPMERNKVFSWSSTTLRTLKPCLMALREAELLGDPWQKPALSLGSVPLSIAVSWVCGGRTVKQWGVKSVPIHPDITCSQLLPRPVCLKNCRSTKLPVQRLSGCYKVRRGWHVNNIRQDQWWQFLLWLIITVNHLLGLH